MTRQRNRNPAPGAGGESGVMELLRNFATPVNTSGLNNAQRRNLNSRTAQVPSDVPLDDPAAMQEALIRMLQGAGDLGLPDGQTRMTGADDFNDMLLMDSSKKALEIWSKGMEIFLQNVGAAFPSPALDNALKLLAEAYLLDEKGCTMLPGMICANALKLLFWLSILNDEALLGCRWRMKSD